MIMYEKFNIKSTKISSTSVNVIWEDDKKSYFHFLWLRDNCSTGIHPDARMRTFNLLDITENIYPISSFINNNKELEIKWSEGNHTSTYSLSWLRDNCYTINNKKKYESKFILWDYNIKDQMNKLVIEYDEIIDSEKGLLNWLEKLNNYGLAIIKNSPTEKKSAFKILNKISHLRETFFGTPFEVINIPKPNNTAYTSESLRNHTDLPYYEYAPGFQFLHCLVNDADGGMSTAVDGFSVANFLKLNDPKTFDLLLKTYVKFTDEDYTQNKKRIFYSPLITLTKDKDFNDIRFSMGAMGVIDIHPDLMENFYKAYRKFALLLHSKKFTINFRLEAGDIFCFNNRRILHGRTEFNPSSGHRHLQGYYIDRDEIISRLNYLQSNVL